MIDAQLLPFVERYRATWPVPGHRLGLSEWRAKYEQTVAASRPPPPPGVSVRDAQAATPPVPVRVCVPQGEPRGTIVYFHGGGWVIGSLDSHEDITADLASDTRCAVVSVGYSLAPEHPFPTAFEQCASVVRSVSAGGLAAMRVPAKPLFVAGDSAGGNLAAAAAIALAGSDTALVGQILFYPCVDTNFDHPSYRNATSTPFLDAEQMAWFWQQYAPDGRSRADYRAVPARASAEQLGAVPPAFIAVAEHDPLRDEGIAYAGRLAALGRPVHLEAGDGLVHGYLRLRRAAREPARIYAAMRGWVEQVLATAAS